MSEPADRSRRPEDEDEEARAGSDDAGTGQGSVRTTGETSVDEAMGAGDDPTR
jgi:hypothetical protein